MHADIYANSHANRRQTRRSASCRPLLGQIYRPPRGPISGCTCPLRALHTRTCMPPACQVFAHHKLSSRLSELISKHNAMRPQSRRRRDPRVPGMLRRADSHEEEGDHPKREAAAEGAVLGGVAPPQVPKHKRSQPRIVRAEPLRHRCVPAARCPRARVQTELVGPRARGTCEHQGSCGADGRARFFADRGGCGHQRGDAPALRVGDL